MVTTFPERVSLTAADGAGQILLETLEPRLLLSASPAEVISLKWCGQTVQAVADQWILGLADPQVSLADLQADLAGQALLPARSQLERIGQSQFARLTAPGAAGDDLEDWAAGRSDVAYIEPNFARRLEDCLASVIPNDASFSSLWGLHNTGQSGGTADADIDAPEAWEIATGSRDVIVGVIDTGIDHTHPDLAANIWTNPGEVAGDGVDNDRNGYVDDVHGYDFAHNSADTSDRDQHGTHVAGTIGAVGDNARGVAGINWNVQLIALGVLSDGGWIEYDDTIEALAYVTMMKRDHGVNVVVTNNSWGGGDWHAGLYDAFGAAGEQDILCICAAGNGGWDGVGDNNDSAPFYPANYNLDCIISVAASDRNDRLTSWSNYGAATVDLAAPGNDVYSTVPGGQYASFSGTSMATPHVTGTAALLAAANPNATAAQIKSAILAGVDRVAALNGKVAADGRLNAHKALLEIGGDGGGDDDDGDTTGPRVVTISPPASATPVDTITVEFSEDLLDESVVPENFRLRDDGADDTFDTADDTVFAFTSSDLSELSPGRVRIQLGGSLPAERYRLTIVGTGATGVRDPHGNALNGGADEVYVFEIRQSSGPSEPNDRFADASDTGLSGPGSATVSARIGDGAQGAADVDLFGFDARAGDVLTADIDASQAGSDLDPMLRLFDAAGYELAYNDDHDGLDSYLRTTLHQDGRYYLGVSGYPNGWYDPAFAGSGRTGSAGEYQLQITLTGDAAPDPDPDPDPDPGPDPDPDEYGYVARAVAPAFEDISRTGHVGLGRPADDRYFVLSPRDLSGFEFSFYGQAAQYLYVSSNGLITLNWPDTEYENTDLTSCPTVPAIAPYWDDLVVGGSRRAAVLWEVRGSGDSQRLILQWNQVRFYGGAGAGQITFQAVLYEADGAIQFNYLDLASTHPGAEGAGATVGIKDSGVQAAGGRVLQICVNDGPNPFVGTGKSTRISPAGNDGEDAPPVQLITPTGTETVERGQTFRIEWIGGSRDATVTLLQCGPGGWIALAADLPASASGYNWDTSGAREGWYYFGAQVFDDGQSYSAFSPGWLHVVNAQNQAPTVVVTSPAENIEILRGEEITITWAAHDPNSRPLQAAVWAYSREAGWFQPPGAASLDASVGSFTWDTDNATPGWYTFSVWVGNGATWTSAASPGEVHVVLPTAALPGIWLELPDPAGPIVSGRIFEIRWVLNVPASAPMCVYLWVHDQAGRWSQINAAGTDAAAGRFRWDTSDLSPGVYSVAAGLGGYGDVWSHVFRANWLRVM